MIERMDQERCTCGSDDCPSCFPGGSPYENDNVPTLGEAGIRLPTDKSIAEACIEAVKDMAAPPAPREIWNPKWVRPSMTIEQAAKEANLRGYVLKSHWSPGMGLSITAVSIL